MTASGTRRYWLVLLAAICCVGTAGAMDALTPTSGTGPQITTADAQGFWPDLSWPTLSWFGAIAILTMTLRVRPIPWLRNLDGVVLAGMCLLLGLRETSGTFTQTGLSWKWWAYLGLTVTTFYWLLRGIGLLISRQPAPHPGAVSIGVRLVLLLAGLTLCIYQIVTAPISRGAQDGIVGGLYLAEYGKLPYGEAPNRETHSPLLYLLDGGAVTAMPPTIQSGSSLGQRLTWSGRNKWLREDWAQNTDLAAARMVNALLFVLMLFGIYALGWLVQGPTIAWLMVAIFCVFPGTLECLGRPQIMLPAVLLTWTAVFALVPGVGGLLSTFLLVMTGVAWPWAWLALPVLLAHFWRRGWHAVGGTAGLIGGVALVLVGLVALVPPALPRETGAFAIAGMQPEYRAVLNRSERRVEIMASQQLGQEGVETGALSRYLWRPLIKADDTTIRPGTTAPNGDRIELPEEVGKPVLYREVAPVPAALGPLQAAYRADIGHASWWTRLLASTRTVLEATWPLAWSHETPVTGAWTMWSGANPSPLWINLHRAAKVLAVVLALWAGLAILVGGRLRPRNLVGGLLLVVAAAMLASTQGAVTNLVWLIPLVTLLWALHDQVQTTGREPAQAFSWGPPLSPSSPPPGERRLELPPEEPPERKPVVTPPPSATAPPLPPAEPPSRLRGPTTEDQRGSVERPAAPQQPEAPHAAGERKSGPLTTDTGKRPAPWDPEPRISTDDGKSAPKTD